MVQALQKVSSFTEFIQIQITQNVNLYFCSYFPFSMRFFLVVVGILHTFKIHHF